jgi:hypothetical protein
MPKIIVGRAFVFLTIAEHGDHLREDQPERLCRACPCRFPVNEKVQDQQPACAYGCHEKDVVVRDRLQDGNEDQREEKCPEVDRPVIDPEPECRVGFIGHPRDRPGHHGLEESCAQRHQDEAAEDRAISR